jgi:hypothetical protein
MSKAIIKKIQDIKTFLETKGWSADRWGNYKKSVESREYRLKFNKISLRHEIKSSSGWIRLKSNYYKNLEIEDDKLVGLKR